MCALRYEKKELYPYLLQHAIRVKSWFSLYELSCLVLALSWLRDADYFYPFMVDISDKLALEELDPNVYANLWEAIVSTGFALSDHKVKPLLKQIESIYTLTKTAIGPNTVLRAGLGAARTGCKSPGFWST